MRVSRVLLIGLFLSALNADAGEVRGPYSKRLSASDVAQIKAAVAKEPGVSHSLKKIDALRPDTVAIQTATRTAVDEDTFYDFQAYKRSGRWTIDASSIQMSIEKRDFRTHGPEIIR